MSDLLTRLIAAGTPPELVGEVAMLLAEKKLAQEAIEGRRAADRERSARRRAKPEFDHVTSRDNTGQHVTARDVTDQPSLSRPPLSSPQTPQQTPPTHTHPEHTPRARTRGTRLPADWQPEPFTGEMAKAVAAWPPGAIERELAQFRDWAAAATGQNALKADWQAAWRNWCRRKNDEGFRHDRRNANQPAPARPPRNEGDGFTRALDRLDAGLAERRSGFSGGPAGTSW